MKKMKKLSFNKEHLKTKHGVPKALKVALVGAIALTTLSACNEADDCTTTTTDLNESADLGAQQDPNTFCDND